VSNNLEPSNCTRGGFAKSKQNGHYAMGAHAIALPTSQTETITAHRLSLQDDLINALTPAEKAFVAAIGSLLANGLTDAGDAAAKGFLDAAPNAQAARRRAYSLLSFAEDAINDISSLSKEMGASKGRAQT
jgi:hypothetical protein